MSDELSPWMRRREALETRAVNAVGGAMERASWHTCRSVGLRLGLVFYAALRKRRGIATRNVQLAFPHLSETAARQIVRRSCQNFGITFCEFLHMRTANRDDIRAHSDIDHLEIIQDALGEGRGVLLLTAHLGNWEMMGARAAQEFPLTVIARPTGNAGIESHIASIRAAGKVQVISKYDTGRSALKVLRRNEALGILPDQHAGADGALLPFFGQPTRFVTALTRLSLMADAPIVPAFGVRQGPWLRNGRIVAQVKPAFRVEKTGNREHDILEGTRRVVHEIEEIIRQYPDQWLWLHRRWRGADMRTAEQVSTQPAPETGLAPTS